MMLCSDATLLVHAYLDNELGAGESIELSRHLDGCLACSAALERHGQLRQLLQRVQPQYPIPDAARARVIAALPMSATDPASRSTQPRRLPTSKWRALPTALAASVLLLIGGGIGSLAQRQTTASHAMTEAVLSSHLRSLQAQHLTDVATSDRHTVKPWFDGKLDFSPQVRDLAADGFVLVGGRLDVLDGNRVAAIVYRRRLHAINLFQWPGPAADSLPTGVEAGDGFAAVHWTQDGMNFWAVSNLDRAELEVFAKSFLKAPAIPVQPDPRPQG